MAIYTLHTPPPLDRPILVMGLAGWGDAASAASDAADWLAEDGHVAVEARAAHQSLDICPGLAHGGGAPAFTRRP